MFIVKKILVIMAVIGLVNYSSVLAGSAEEFFKTAPDRAEKYPPDKVYPQGRIFPLSLYSVGGGSGRKVGHPEKALRRVKQDGFTMIGPQYELNNRVISDAKKYGLKCVYTVGGASTKLSSREIQKIIQQNVKKVCAHPEIAWWNLAAEELRYWRKTEMRYLKIVTRAIRQADPLKRPIMMYEPNHRDASALTHTVKFLDICSKGTYTNYAGHRDSRIWVRWSIEQEIEAIKKSNPSAIPIAVLEMFQQPPEDKLALIPAWVRHDVYLSLITGAKGIIIFSMRERPKFDAHETYYRAYAQCARELTNPPLNLGQVFLFGEKRNDLDVQVVDGPKTLPLKLKDDKTITYSSVSFLDIAYGKERYLFVVNSANEPVRIVVDNLPHVEIVAKNLFNGHKFLVNEGNFEVKLNPLGVKGFAFKLQTVTK